MRNKTVAFLFLMIFLSVVTSAALYIPQSTNYSLRFNCELDGSICSSSSACNVSISYPNSTTLIDEEPATLTSNGKYHYNLTDEQTSVLGENYKLDMICYDGVFNGSQTAYFGINPSGIEPSLERTNTITRSIYFFFVLGVLLLVGFFFTKQSVPVKWTIFASAILFLLIGINTIFVGLQDEIVNPQIETFFSSFTAISWYLYWFIAGLLIIMWLFTFINTWIHKKNQDNFRRFG